MNIGPQRPESMIGQVIADYELTAFIGTGATGLVYRGRRTAAAPNLVEKTGMVALEFPEDAAIKLLVPPLGATQDELEDFQRRFLREARTLKQLHHPHILPVIDFGQDTGSGYFYMVLTYMAGGSLANAIATRGPLPLAETSSILAQVADALDYAHAQDVIHRDVKPGNILLDAHGSPFLSDFSIVRLLSEAATQRTTTGRMMGTPAYMAPEQFDDSSKVGAAADIYGLGMVVYEMVTGHAAFGAKSWAQVMRQQLQDMPTLPGATRPDLPRPAEAAIMQALAKEPAQRFPDSAAFARAFSQGLQGQWADGLTRYVAPRAQPTITQSGAQTMPATQPDRPRSRSRLGVLSAAVALLLVVACVAAAVFALPGSPLLAMFQPHTPTAGAQATTTLAQTAAPTGSHTPGAHVTATTKKGSSAVIGGGGGTTPSATSAAPTATTKAGPPVAIYGNGSDGALSIPSNTTFLPLDATCTGVSGSTSLSFASASNAFSFVSGKPVLIMQMQGNGAGAWMQNTIVSSPGTTSGTLTLQSPLNTNYSAGAQIIVLHEYTNVTVDAGATWSAKPWNGATGGVLAFLANGTVTVAGTITASGSGFRGADAAVNDSDGKQGEGQNNNAYDGISNNPNGSGGGGGWDGTLHPGPYPFGGGGGAGGGNLTAGGNGASANQNAQGGTGGTAVGSSSFSNIWLGGGGGSGGHKYGGNSGAGGAGGGIIYIAGANVAITGAIIANGYGGGNSNGGDSGGGGGGAGGSIYIKTQTASGTSQVAANGGSGGQGAGSGAVGGNGGSGKIFIG